MWFEPRMYGAPLEIPGSWAWRWKIKGISKASIIVVQVDCFFCCCSDVLVCSGFPPHPEQTNCGRNCGVSGILYWISLNSWRVKLNVTSTRCSAGWAKSDVFYCRAIKLKEWNGAVCAPGICQQLVNELQKVSPIEKLDRLQATRNSQ